VCLLCMLVEPWLAARRRRRALTEAGQDSGNHNPADGVEDDEEDPRS